MGLRLFNLSASGQSFFFSEIRRKKIRFACFLLLGLVAAIIEMTGVGLVFPLLILIVEPDSLQRFPVAANAVAQAPEWIREHMAITLLGLIGVVLVSKNIFMLMFNWMTQSLLAGCKSSLSERLFSMYLFADYEVHLRKTTSEVIRNMSLVAAVYDQFIANAMTFVVNVTILSGLCILLIFILPPNTLVSLVVIGVISFLVYRVARGYFEKAGDELNSLFKDRQTVLKQSIGMIKETKVMAKEHFFHHAYMQIEGRNFNRVAKNNLVSSIPPLVIEAAVLLAVLSVVSYLLFFSGETNIGLAILGAMAATLFRLMPVLNKCLTSMQVMNLGRSSLEIVAGELEDLAAEIRGEAGPSEEMAFREELVFDDVSYRYPEGREDVLKDISFSLKKGEKLGITGASGSGKSSLAALMMGLVAPADGRITIDGVVLDRDSRRRGWQKLLGYIPQASFILEDTIAGNIAFGQKKEDIDYDRIWEVLRIVNMEDFVRALPSGVDEFLYEDGIQLSGGQKQRLNIARVLYIEPQVLLMDEATSGLDAENEARIGETFADLSSDTFIIIAHRLSSLKHCDRIIMMDQGRILDCAPFDILYSRCAPFRNLVEKYNLPRETYLATGTGGGNG